MDYFPPYAAPTAPFALYEMAERATQSRPGDPVIRLSGTGTVRAVELRPHSRGGGYLGDVRIQRARQVMSGNLATYRFGRGWQSSIRDNAGEWNPTQGGFRETVGVGARLIPGPDVVNIAPFRVPLFQHSGTDGFDFTENENLAADDFPGDRGRDDDLLGGEKTQAEEVNSNMSYRGTYEVIRGLGIPAFRHRFYYAFDQPMVSIRQFRTTARTADGKPVFNPALVRPGFNKFEPSNIILSYGIRFQDLPGFTFTHGSVNTDPLRVVPKSPDGNNNRDRMEVPAEFDPRSLAMISTSATGGFAVGLYAPPEVNRSPVPGAGDRRLESKFVFVRDSGGANLIYRSLIDGLHQGEQLYGDVIVLFGTRAEILSAVATLEAN